MYTSLTSLSSIFLSYIIDLGTHTINGPASWRIPVGLQMLWGFILLSGIFFLPESPYVLARVLFCSFRLTSCLHQASPSRYGESRRGPPRRGGAEQPICGRPSRDRDHRGARIRHPRGERRRQGDMARVFLHAQPAVEAHDQRHDVAVHSAAERPELLLYALPYALADPISDEPGPQTTTATRSSRAQARSKF